jgi:two-component system phosphate regulon sensor histidine kinase PhoR
MQIPKAVRRLLPRYLVLHLIAVAIFVLILTRIARNQMVHDARIRMSSMAVMLSNYLDHLENGIDDSALSSALKSMGEQTRVRLTVINETGEVAADSETGTRDIGPHDTREEILMAKANGQGFSERYSATLDQRMLYYASVYQPANPDNRRGFLRIAIPGSSMDEAILSIQKLIWLFGILMAALTGILMIAFSARSMKPLNEFATAARRIGLGKYERGRTLKHRHDEWGELANAFEQMQDEITRREESLLDNSQRLEAVLFSMIEGVLAINANGVVMLANDAACRMFSLSLNDIRGRKLIDIVRIPELHRSIERTQQHSTFSKTEFTTLTDPKRRLSARVSVLAKQSHPGVAVVLHDVTELRQLETMRQDFVANVSHELKTPLSSIKAYTETLKLGAIHDQEKNMHFVERIESQALQLERQIQDLLELARVESGTAAFRISDVPINAVCQKCFDQFTPHAESNHVRLQLDLVTESPIVRADQDAIETIVKNLVVNAIHYTPAGGLVTIETNVERDQAIIRVSDTGIGISPDQQARIFERFYRVDRARSREKGGTGLGLAIVKHLTQAFGGSVQLESQIGKGSRFQVRLPLTD